MRGWFFLLMMAGILHSAHCQKIEAMLPVQPVTLGTAFQIQFVITGPSSSDFFQPPSFDSLRVVSGPNRYRGISTNAGGTPQTVENITYTLVALHAGRLHLGRAIAGFKNDGQVSSEDITLTIQSPPPASYRSRSNYTDVSLYAPSKESASEALIPSNIFVKAEASRQRAYMGEAIVISFTLYSRMQSTSEVLNSPSLYGLSVADMVNTNESHLSVDTIGGKIFNASLLRKVQVYSNRSGRIEIDPIQVSNEIEFRDAAHKSYTTETVIASEPLVLTILPLPEPTPASYSGAVGKFSIEAGPVKSQLRVGEAAHYRITVRGSGNFMQLGMPQVNWPSSFNAFDPVASENFDRSKAPLSGSLSFDYSFTADSAGQFTIPPVDFSFFDPAARVYRSLHTDSMAVQVIPAAASASHVQGSEKKQARPQSLWWLLLLVPVAAICFFIFKRRQKDLPALTTSSQASPLAELRNMDIATLSDSEACRRILILVERAVGKRKLPLEDALLLREMKADCELQVYAPVESSPVKETIKARALDLLSRLEA